MRKHNRKNFSSGSNPHIHSPSDQRVRGTLPDTTIPLSPKPYQWRGDSKIESTFSLSIDSHITIFPKVELSRKRISLLLEQSILRVKSEGFSLIDYFSFEWMVNYLIGTYDLHSLNGKRLGTVVYCAYLILLSYEGNHNFLLRKEPLNQRIVNFITENFGNYSDRKYQSRSTIYSLDKFLMVKIENVESYFERSRNSIRYSSYCKGYGESGRSVRKQVTQYSFELDRDDNEAIPEEFYSFWESIHYQEDLYEIEQYIRMEKKKR